MGTYVAATVSPGRLCSCEVTGRHAYIFRYIHMNQNRMATGCTAIDFCQFCMARGAYVARRAHCLYASALYSGASRRVWLAALEKIKGFAPGDISFVSISYLVSNI